MASDRISLSSQGVTGELLISQLGVSGARSSRGAGSEGPGIWAECPGEPALLATNAHLSY